MDTELTPQNVMLWTGLVVIANGLLGDVVGAAPWSMNAYLFVGIGLAMGGLSLDDPPGYLPVAPRATLIAVGGVLVAVGQAPLGGSKLGTATRLVGALAFMAGIVDQVAHLED